MVPQPITETSPYRIRRAVAQQAWRDALFLHWRVDADRVAPLLPGGTEPDRFDGSSWVGLIAFRLLDAKLGPLGPLPFVSDFVEVNVRLYAVDGHGRRGVVFRSLEAASLPAVAAARAAFGLPYFWARTSGGVDGDAVEYRSERRGARAEFAAAATVGTEPATDPLSLFLTARWGMFTRRFGATRFLANEHEPWVLHRAHLTGLDDDLLALAGLPNLTTTAPDSVLFSRGVHARFGTAS